MLKILYKPYAEYCCRVKLPWDEFRAQISRECARCEPFRLFNKERMKFTCRISRQQITLIPIAGVRNGPHVIITLKEELAAGEILLNVVMQPGNCRWVWYMHCVVALCMFIASMLTGNVLFLLPAFILPLASLAVLIAIRSIAESEIPAVEKELVMLFKDVESNFPGE